MDRITRAFQLDPAVERLLRPHPEELQGLEENIRALRALIQKDPNDPDVAFQYAASLVSHSRLSYIDEGTRILERLVFERVTSERLPSYEPAFYSGARSRPVVGVVLESSTGDTRGGVVTGSAVRPDALPDYAAGVEGDLPSEECSSEAQSVVRASAPPASLQHDDVVKSGEDQPRPKYASIDDTALYYYYLTIAWIKKVNYSRAEICIEKMLEIAPRNKQGLALREYIHTETLRSGAIVGVAGASVLLAAGAIIGGLLASSRR